MTTCRQYIQLFWLVALLVLAGGNLVHAHQDLCNLEAHHEAQGLPDKNECPSGHQCTNTHAQEASILPESSLPVGLSVSTFVYFIEEVACPGGALDEITYPPRLS